MELLPWQADAIPKLDSGKVLYGPVGSGKGFTALAYYVEKESPLELVVITTARKRDSGDWIREAMLFDIGEHHEMTLHGTITVDSWNNVMNYVDRKNCFFIFDEQRIVGNGTWVKSFIKIAKNNRWLLLTGTPGDTWMDYAPIFIANGFYKNITEFKHGHVMYASHVKYPQIKGYFGVRKLEVLRNEVLVEMPMPRQTKRFVNWMDVGHDKERLDVILKRRWNIFEDKPIKDASEMWRLMRRVVNEDTSRLEMIIQLMKLHPRLIVFYNFDYELDILRWLHGSPEEVGGEFEVAEYNGHTHDPTPTGEKWVYLVQYVAGAEAWNCVSTNAIAFYSLTYSWKNFEQCKGRIDRLNTSFIDLFYYVLVSNTVIDRKIRLSLEEKKQFNERKAAEEVAAEIGFVSTEGASWT